MKYLFILFVFILSVTFVEASFELAPELDISKTPTMSALDENAGAPAGVVGTSVSNLVDSVPPSGGLDNVSGGDGPLGIAIVAVNSNFTCYYSINSGSSWSPVGSVGTTTARLLAAGGTNRIYCQPDAEVSGSFTDVITFRAWDQRTGTNGGTDDTTDNGGVTGYSEATDGVSMTVNAIDDTAPETIILTVSADSVESSSFEASFVSNEDGSTFECKINGGTFASCTSPYSTSTLSAGERSFYVRATDAADNTDVSPAEFSWTIYADVPEVIEKFPTEEATGVAINTPIIFTFDAPVSEELQSHIITEGLLCTDSCPTLTAVWSEGNTVVTYTAAEDYSMNGGYSIGLRLDDNTLADLSYVLFTTGTERIEPEEEEEPRRRSGSRIRKADTAFVAPIITPSSSTQTNINSSKLIFTRDLTIGDTGNDVKELQKFLNKNGFVLAESGPGSTGNETNMFGGLTRAALIKYQISKGIVPAIGYFGPITRTNVLAN